MEKSKKRLHLMDQFDVLHSIYLEAKEIGEAFDDNELEIDYGVRRLYQMLENDCRNAYRAVDLLLERDDKELPEIGKGTK